MAESEVQTSAETIKVPAFVQVGEFANLIGQPVGKVVGELMKNVVLATINEIIDFDTAAIVAEYLGVSIELEGEAAASVPQTQKGKAAPRPPVIAVMGHVDHGKTSLLDAIRETEVAKGESGGITQHIGAYQVTRNGKSITFLDTPGHEAFTAMRAHGANITDIVVLVVAADDGVKPQTIEAGELAKSAGVPIIVAINKIDKPGADVNRVMGELAGMGLNPETWGGDTVTVEISAKTKLNLEKLLDMIVLVADLKSYQAEPDAPATGVVIESHIDYGKGPVATILVQNGTLKVGDALQAGETYGRIRAMEDYRGKKIKEASPAMPVKVSGLKEVPPVAESVQVFPDDTVARAQAELARKRKSAKRAGGGKKIGIEALTASVKAGAVKELNVILKADVAGSLTALLESIEKIKNEEVAVKVVSSGVGDVNDSEVQLAASTGAVILGFHVGIVPSANAAAGKSGVKISMYSVIYELLNDVKAALSSLLTPERVEIETGKLKILKIFMTAKTEMIFGGKVEEGKISRGDEFQILRGKEVITKGKITSVKREKDEVKEAAAGGEYGLQVTIDAPKLVAEGDLTRAYRVEEHARSL